jgi:predicted transcriptional regulator
MIKTSDMMMTSPVCIRRATRIAAAAEQLLHSKEISGVPIVDCDGHLIGMFSETDQYQKSQSDRDHAPISTRITRDPIYATTHATVPDVAQNFRERNVHRLTVIAKAGQVVGVIGCRDCARTVRDLEHLVQELYQAVARSPVHSLASPDNLEILCNVD